MNDELNWQYDEQSGVVVAEIDDEHKHLNLVVEDDTHPYVEIYGWTYYQGWDLLRVVDIGDQPNLEASKKALEDWCNSDNL